LRGEVKQKIMDDEPKQIEPEQRKETSVSKSSHWFLATLRRHLLHLPQIQLARAQHRKTLHPEKLVRARLP
jgi:hypothetical protein